MQIKNCLLGAAALVACGSANATTNVALAPAATFVSASSFLDFSAYNISLDPNGQQTAQNNLLTTTPVPYTSNDEPRYIFGANDADESLVIELGGARTLTSVGATWFDAAYQDRAPSSVSVSFSSDGVNFGPVTTAASLPYGGGSAFLDLPTPVTARYVDYAFGGNGGVAIQEVFADAVPEPASWALMLLGFGGLGLATRQRRQLTA